MITTARADKSVFAGLADTCQYSFIRQIVPQWIILFADVLSMSFATETMIVLEEVNVNQEDADKINK